MAGLRKIEVKLVSTVCFFRMRRKVMLVAALYLFKWNAVLPVKLNLLLVALEKKVKFEGSIVLE